MLLLCAARKTSVYCPKDRTNRNNVHRQTLSATMNTVCTHTALSTLCRKVVRTVGGTALKDSKLPPFVDLRLDASDPLAMRV